jgi:mannosyltransferase OCH1-like enzyme
MENTLVKNNYYITDNIFNDDFSIIIYYLTENKCKIIIRRLDDYSWGQDLKIKLMNIDDTDYEKISVGSCDENFKIVEYYTNILLYKYDYIDQIIPKVIIQTSNYNMNLNIYHYNSIMTFIELNPEYEYIFFTDNECREFIKKNISKNIFNKEFENNDLYNNDILKAYDLLIPGALKCDFFKYCYLYINGGCYFHCKTILKKSLCKIIEKDDKIILCGDEKSYYGGIIMVEKNNNYIYDLLKESYLNILNQNKEINPFYITRKLIFYEYFNNIESKLIRNNNNIYLNNIEKKEENVVLRMFYKNYYNNYYNTNRDFRYMWNKNIIFYKNNITINGYNFYYYLDNDNDKFEIQHLKNNIFSIKRTDCNCGWGQNIILNIINNDKIYNIIVGNSIENEKQFIVE